MDQKFLSIDINKSNVNAGVYTFDFNVRESCINADFIVIQNLPVNNAIVTALPVSYYKQGDDEYLNGVNLTGTRLIIGFLNDGYSIRPQ